MVVIMGGTGLDRRFPGVDVRKRVLYFAWGPAARVGDRTWTPEGGIALFCQASAYNPSPMLLRRRRLRQLEARVRRFYMHYNLSKLAEDPNFIQVG